MKKMLKATLFLLMVGFLVAGCVTHPEIKSAEKDTPYTFPLESPGAQFGALPPAVKNAVRAEAGAAEITEVVQLDHDGVPMYEVHFRNRDLFPPLYVAADGSVLRPDLSLAVGAPVDRFGVSSGGAVSGINFAELPPKVSKVLRERAPGAVMANIAKETWGDRVVYVISFTDPEHHPKLYLAADGTVMNEGPK